MSDPSWTCERRHRKTLSAPWFVATGLVAAVAEGVRLGIEVTGLARDA